MVTRLGIVHSCNDQAFFILREQSRRREQAIPAGYAALGV
jgi:hypothetical protein